MPNISITEIIIIICVYLSSSIPWAVLIGRIRLKDDIRNYGDNNPGTVNVFRAGGIFWGFVTAILEIGKSAPGISGVTFCSVNRCVYRRPNIFSRSMQTFP